MSISTHTTPGYQIFMSPSNGLDFVYINAAVKHAIWLVNARSGWDNPAREIWKLTSLRILRACYGLKIADKKPFQLLKLAESEDKNAKAQSKKTISFYVVKRL